MPDNLPAPVVSEEIQTAVATLCDVFHNSGIMWDALPKKQEELARERIAAKNRLLRALETLEKDKQRLDDAERRKLNINYWRGDEDHWDGWYCTDEHHKSVDNERTEYRSLRQAIDDAVSPSCAPA